MSEDYNSLVATAKRHAPICIFDSKEGTFPCTVEYLLANCSLKFKECVLKRLGKVTRGNLADCQSIYSPSHLSLDVSKSIWAGESPSSINRVPYYVHFLDNFDGTLDIEYIMLYPYNGSVRICMCCCPVGSHQGDIEHFTLRIDRSTKKPIKAYLSAHRGGKWWNWTDLPRIGDIPLLQIARNTHAVYGKEGYVPRIFLFVWDRADGNGVRWCPDTIEVIDDSTDWNLYEGYMGYPDSGHVPKLHGWWNKEETKSDTWYSRIFCPWRSNY